jgi:hypothetical protein
MLQLKPCVNGHTEVCEFYLDLNLSLWLIASLAVVLSIWKLCIHIRKAMLFVVLLSALLCSSWVKCWLYKKERYNLTNFRKITNLSTRITKFRPFLNVHMCRERKLKSVVTVSGASLKGFWVSRHLHIPTRLSPYIRTVTAHYYYYYYFLFAPTFGA